MRGRLTALAFALLVVLPARAEGIRPVLSDGVVSFVAEDGQRREIRVGKRCADLWVSADESIVAFIAIDKAQPATAQEIGPFIEESSIYIARRSDHFKAVRLPLKSLLVDGQPWRVVREPSVSPDLKTVYFLIPYTMTTWKLMSTSLPSSRRNIIGDAMTYCVIWGGGHSGDLLMMRRRDSDPRDPVPGVKYPCYLRAPSGEESMIVDGVRRECWDFDDFAIGWSRQQGGTCQPAGIGGPAGSRQPRDQGP